MRGLEVQSRFAAAWLFGATLCAAGCPLLPAVNPFDPDAPDDIRAPATVAGLVRYEDGRVGGDVLVEALSDTATGQAVATVNTDLGTGGFLIQVPTQVTYLRFVPERAGFLPTLVPVRLFPGETVDIGAVTLLLGPPIHTLAGRVERLDGQTPAGAKIEVRSAASSGDGCESAVVGEALAGEDGRFTIEGVREGVYRVSAFREGLTVDVSEEVTLTAGPSPEDTEQSPPEVVLTLGDATGAVTLSATEAGLPEGVVRLPEVQVGLALDIAWAEDMRISHNPTFVTGSTDWIPAEDGRVYALPDDETDVRVYVQLRSSCALSPLYMGRIIHDAHGPAVSTVRLGLVSALPGGDGPAVGQGPVVVDEAVSVPLAVDAFDETGLSVEATVYLWRTPEERAQDGLGPPLLGPTVFEEATPGLAALRSQLTVPIDEGRYLVQIVVRDLAGNLPGDGLLESFDGVYEFDVIRDSSPPTTPVPSVSELVAHSPWAVVWLEERPCLGGPPALVCEVNKPDANFFQVRGGELIDFVGFDDPPFVVRVPPGESEIEIRAVDLAGNPSESTARVQVTRALGTDVFTASSGHRIGPAERPELAADDSVVFLRVDPDSAVPPEHPYSYLVAQPVDVPPLGLDLSTSPFAAGLRKINFYCLPGDCGDTYSRELGPFAADAGRLAWWEGPADWSFLYNNPRPRSRVWMASIDEFGRYSIGNQAESFGANPVVDAEGDPAQSPNHRCREDTGLQCTESNAWRSRQQAAPTSAALAGRRLGVTGTALLDDYTFDGDDVRTEVVVGPAVIGVAVDTIGLDERLWWQLDVAMEAVEGTPLQAGVWVRQVATGYNPYPESENRYSRAAGGGWESLTLDDVDGAIGSASFNPLVLGVLVPEGETATFSVVDLTTGPEQPGGFLTPLGLVVADAQRIQAAAEPYHRLTLADVDSYEPGLGLRGVLHIADADPSGQGRGGGLTFVDLGANLDLDPILLEEEQVVAGVATDREERVVAVPVQPAILPFTQDDGVTLETPAEPCTILVDAEVPINLRDVKLDGYGLLSDLSLRFYKNDSGLVGRYEPYSPKAGYPTNGAPLVRDIPSGSGPACQTNVLSSRTELVSGLVPAAASSTQQVQVMGDGPTYAVTAPLSTLLQVASLEVPVDADGIVVMNGVGGGDADLYVRWDGQPDGLSDDCGPETSSSDEFCALHNNTGSPRTLYVAVRGWDGNVPVEVTTTTLNPVIEIPVSPGQRVTVTSTGTGDIDLYLSQGIPPTYYGADCFSEGPGSSESCEVYVSSNQSSVWVGFAAYGPSVADIDILIEDPVELVVVGTFPVVPGERVRVEATGTPAPSAVYMKFDAPPTVSDNSGYDSFPPLAITDRVVPAGASTVYISGRREIVDIDYTITAFIETRGCTSVRSDTQLGLPYVQATLPPGNYALVVAEDASTLRWPPSAPQVYRSPARAATPGLTVLGPAQAPSFDALGLVVNSVSADVPLCQLRMVTESRVTYDDLAASEDAWLAVVRSRTADGEETRTLRAGPLGADVGNEVELLELGDQQILASQMLPDRARWVEAEAGGLNPRVWEAPRVPGPDLLGEPCLVLDVVQDDVPMAVESATLVGDDVFLAGASAVGQTVRRSHFGGPPCGGATFLEPLPLDGSPMAVAASGRDVFVALRNAFGGDRVKHFDLRSVTALFVGGNLEVSSFDVRNHRVVMALTPRFGSTEGRLVLLERPEVDSLEGLHAAVLASDGQYATPRFLDDDRFAVFARGADGRPRLQVWDLAPRAEEPPQPPTVVEVTSATADLAGAPITSPSDPNMWARELPMETWEGGHLAYLGFAGAERRVVVLDGDPASAQAWASVSSSWEQLVPGGAHRFEAGDRALVAVYPDGTSAGALRPTATDEWTEFSAADTGVLRVLGVVGGKALIVDAPADLYGLEAPTLTPVRLSTALEVTPEQAAADAVGNLPTLTYVHDFLGVLEDARGQVLAYDLDAEPPVLWRINARTRAPTLAAGAHRPLLGESTPAGAAALPRRDADGALLFLQRAGGRTALMRMELP